MIALQEPDEAVLSTVRRFAREVDPIAIDRAGAIPPGVIAQLSALGLFGVTLPVAHGGLGADLRLATQVVAALAELDRSVATTVGLHLGLGTRGLVRYGSARLQAEVLPALADGAWVAAFGTTEPQSGSDLSRLKTRVVREGKGFCVTGEKSYVTNGGIAGVLTVTANADGGMAMVALPMSAPGVVRAPEERKLGLRGSSTRSCLLEGVKVPAHWMLGDPSTGKAQLDHVLAWGRTLLSAGCVGAATTALARARAHTAMRRQFGRTLDAQPVVRAQLGSATVLRDAMAALMAEAAAQTDDRALHRWSVSAKVFCSEQGSAVIDTALQLHGAIGYFEDSGLPLLLRDVRVTRIFEGANDVLLTHAGALELHAPQARDGLPAAARPFADQVHRRVQQLRRTLGVRVFGRPDLLHHLGQAVVWRDAITAGAKVHRSTAWQRTLCREAAAARRGADRRQHAPDDLAELLS